MPRPALRAAPRATRSSSRAASIYRIAGEARAAYEHSIPAVSALRYSVTFRTRRRPG